MSARRRILITGLHGTVAPYVAKAAEKQGYHVVSWSRDIVDPTSLGDANMFLFRMNLDAIVHCASGPEVWGGIMAHFAAKNNIPFLPVRLHVYNESKQFVRPNHQSFS